MTTIRREKELRLSFKGDRTYLTGADIYSAGIDMLREISPRLDGRCRVAFHQIARRSLKVLVDSFDKNVARPKDCVAEIHVTGGPQEASAWFFEGDEEIGCRYPFDEDAIVGACPVSNNQIVMRGVPECTVIEAIVAMTKKLHNEVCPTMTGRWILTRLDFKRLPRNEDLPSLTIRLTRRLGESLTTSDVLVSGQNIGAIFFSVARL